MEKCVLPRASIVIAHPNDRDKPPFVLQTDQELTLKACWSLMPGSIAPPSADLPIDQYLQQPVVKAASTSINAVMYTCAMTLFLWAAFQRVPQRDRTGRNKAHQTAIDWMVSTNLLPSDKNNHRNWTHATAVLYIATEVLNQVGFSITRINFNPKICRDLQIGSIEITCVRQPLVAALLCETGHVTAVFAKEKLNELLQHRSCIRTIRELGNDGSYVIALHSEQKHDTFQPYDPARLHELLTDGDKQTQHHNKCMLNKFHARLVRLGEYEVPMPRYKTIEGVATPISGPIAKYSVVFPTKEHPTIQLEEAALRRIGFTLFPGRDALPAHPHNLSLPHVVNHLPPNVMFCRKQFEHGEPQLGIQCKERIQANYMLAEFEGVKMPFGDGCGHPGLAKYFKHCLRVRNQKYTLLQSWTGYINHGAATKCNVKFDDEGKLVSIKEIAPGEELLLRYDLRYWVMQWTNIDIKVWKTCQKSQWGFAQTLFMRIYTIVDDMSGILSLQRLHAPTPREITLRKLCAYLLLYHNDEQVMELMHQTISPSHTSSEDDSMEEEGSSQGSDSELDDEGLESPPQIGYMLSASKDEMAAESENERE